MKPLRWTLTLSTPGFLGGADPEKQCEWRAASVRGQLRWWLRAVAGGRFAGDLEKTRQVEEEIFGSTDRGSALVVQLVGGREIVEKDCCPKWGKRLSSDQLGELWRIGQGAESKDYTQARLALPSPVNPVHYLAGQGCFRRSKLTRPALAAGTRAELSIRLRPGRRLSSEAQELLETSLWAWLNLGGLGSRCRRGFGSLTLMNGGEGGQPSSSLAKLREGALGLLDRFPASTTGLPEWSHFSRDSRITLSREVFPTWDQALTHAGAWMMAFRRRYGLAKATSRQRDYHWAKAAYLRQTPGGVPDRAGFGMPLPFGKSDQEIVSWGPRGHDGRRASPLLIHVARVATEDGGEDEYVVVFTHLPARLVPDGESVRFQGLSAPATPPTSQQMSIVDRFLDDLVTKNLLEELSP